MTFIASARASCASADRAPRDMAAVVKRRMIELDRLHLVQRDRRLAERR